MREPAFRRAQEDALREVHIALLDGGSRRLALIHPLEDGRVTGSFGHGTAGA